jgi:hypothetical protein
MMVHTGSERIPILAEAANWRGGTHCHDGGKQINGQGDWQMIGLSHNLAAGRIRKEIGNHERDMHPKPNEQLKKNTQRITTLSRANAKNSGIKPIIQQAF